MEIEKELRSHRSASQEHQNERLQALYNQAQNDIDTESRNIMINKIEEALTQYTILLDCYNYVENSIQSTASNSELAKLKTLMEQETRQWRAYLPIYSKKRDILKTISESRVTILTAETGSGKSTQLVQYLMQNMTTMDHHHNKQIVCTQPRKIAVLSLAKRVAEEMGEKEPGGVVGYKAGAKKVYSKQTKVLFCTDTTLLMEMLSDTQLQRYSYVIVDEAHERSLNTDVLLGMLKRCLSERQDIKIIITSATIDPTLFMRYFQQFGCKVLQVAGKVFPVEILWVPPPPDEDFRSDYLDRMVSRVNDICESDEGDILAFLTNPDEIQQAEKKLQQMRKAKNDVEVLQLHGRLAPEEQQRIYEDVPDNKRKVVFATNCAETSITIPGIKHVVDCGLVKERQFDQIRGTSILKVSPISQSSANQRKGRAGRTAPGICHRLYEKEDFEDMEPSFVPEILRVNLSQALLTLLQHKIEDIINFDFIEKPNATALQKALYSLKRLKAVTESNTLTELGQKMAQITLEPRYSKLVVESFEADQEQGLLSLALAACATVGNLFFRSGTNELKNKADIEKLAFCHKDGDAISNLNLYLQWNQLMSEKEKNIWCASHFVNAKAMRAARDIFNETKGVLTRQFSFQVDERNMPIEVTQLLSFLLRHCILKCFDINLARFSGHPAAGYYNASLDDYLHVHPSSALASCGENPAWIVFDYTMETSKKFMFNATAVDEIIFDECGIEKRWLDKCDAAVLEATNLELGTQMKSSLSKRILRKDVEATICETINSPCVIEPQSNDPLFRVKIYTRSSDMTMAKTLVDERIKHIRLRLEREQMENPTSKRSSLRAITGVGGETTTLLLPDEFVSIKLLNISHQKDEDSVKLQLERFQIRASTLQKHFVSSTQPSKVWGIATFATPQQAKMAFDVLQGQNEIRALPIKAPVGLSGQATQASIISFKLTWSRRLPKTFGFVNLKNPAEKELVAYALSLNISRLTGWNARVKSDGNKPDSIMVQGVAAKSEREFREAIDACLTIHQIADSYKSCSLGRMDKFETTPVMLMELQEELQREIRSKWSLGLIDSTLKIEQPNAQSVDYMVYYNVPIQAEDDCAKIVDSLTENILLVNNQPIHVEASITLNVGAPIYETIKDTFLKTAEELNNSFPNLRFEFKPWKHGVRIKICGTIGGAIDEAKKRFLTLAEGTTFNCRQFLILFSPLGVDFLKKCSSTSNVFAKSYTHKREIILYGSEKDINSCINKIQKFEQERSRSQNLHEISLQGPNRPRGLVKQILQNYDHNIQNLQRAIGLEDCVVLQLNFARRSIQFGGTQLGYETLLALIESCAVILQRTAAELHEGPQCPICLTPVDSDGFCLENCGHYYCQPCICNLVKNAIQSKHFPINCATENCGRMVTMADFRAMKENSDLIIEDLVAASVDSYLQQHGDDYLRCRTPDCDGIFRRSKTGQFCSARCTICQTCTLCTSCGDKEHSAIQSCRANEASKKSEAQMSQWLMEDRQNRKACPKCRVWIEKNGGCKHVHCIQCRAHFCWVCKKVFPDGTEVYKHLGNGMPCGPIF